MLVQNIQELTLWHPTPIRELIGQGILYEGTKLLIFGGPKVFKSLLAQQLVLCLGSVSPLPQWLGHNILPTSSLTVQGELSRTLHRQRLLQMAANYTLDPSRLPLFSTHFNLKLDTAIGMQELNTSLAKHRPQLLVIDPFYKFVSKRDEPTIVHFFDNIDKSIETYHITLVVIHHSRKSLLDSSGTVVDMGAQGIWGTRFIEGWFDSILEIKGDPGNDDRTLTFELRHARQLHSPVTFTLDRKKLLLV